MVLEGLNAPRQESSFRLLLLELEVQLADLLRSLLASELQCVGQEVFVILLETCGEDALICSG